LLEGGSLRATVPNPYRSVVTAGGQQVSLAAEGDPGHGPLVSGVLGPGGLAPQGKEFLCPADVPEFGGAVGGGPDQPGPAGAEGNGGDVPPVPLELGQGLAADGIPEADRLVHSPRGQEPAIRAERQACHGAQVLPFELHPLPGGRPTADFPELQSPVV